jgi:acetyl esterase/lipase
MTPITRGLRLGAGTALLAILAGCSGTGAAATPAPATMGPTPAPTQEATPAAAVMTPAPSPTAAVKVTREVAYETRNDVLEPGVLDVYAPRADGPMPVVVMFHGTPSSVSRESLAEHARRVADLGFVVFNADWGHTAGSGESGMSDSYAYATASNAQVACAIAFARANAAANGGDPSRLIVFGHSGGSNVGGVVAFGGAKPSAGCVNGTEVGPIQAMVTWEGDFLAAPMFDPVLKAEPRFFDLFTPLAHLADKPALPVYMLLSEKPGSNVEAPFSKADLPAFLALRDKDGTLARLMKQTGAIDDGIFSVADEQRVLYEALREQGNPVSLDIMPGSTHMYLSEDGWKVFLAAFEKARAVA